MPDEILTPPPSMPTRPPLTSQMLSDDRVLGAAPPGAGGWTPKPGTVNAVGAIAATAGALAVSLPPLIPGKVGLILGALCGAIAAGCTYFAMKSAGPRAVQ